MSDQQQSTEDNQQKTINRRQDETQSAQSTVPPVSQQSGSPIEELQKQIEVLKIQAEEHLNSWKRAAADLANYKKQVEEERTSWALFSLVGSVSQLLPVLDNLNSALAAQPPMDSVEGPFKQFLIGLGAIKKQFDDALVHMGVVEVAGVGTEFDPMIHESVDKDGEVTGKGTLVVASVLIKGYMTGKQLIRPARVTVKEVNTIEN